MYKTVKLIITISFIYILFILNSNGETIKADTQTPEQAVTHVFIGFEDQIDYSVLQNIAYEINYTYEEIDTIAVTIPIEAIERLKNNKNVDWIEKDNTVTTNSKIIKIASSQTIDWGYQTTVTDKTKEYNLTGKGIKIGIIDTGISTRHPDLKVAGGVSFVEGNPSFEDDNGHGTHVAGIIAAQNNTIGTIGIAPNAEIYAIKALDSNGEGTESAVAAGVQWAIEHDVDIINLSLTTDSPTISLEKILNEAAKQGIIVVASAGNIKENQKQLTDDILYPARYPSVIGVGSVNKDLVQSIFSYSGQSLEYSAPGEGIYSTYIPIDGQVDMYAQMSGTSMAAPFVTGIIALYKDANPSFNIEMIKTLLNRNVIDLGKPDWDSKYGFGLALTPDTMFLDIDDGKWYSQYVDFLIKNDFVKGFEDGTFRPDAPITRGEVVTLIGRIFKLNGDKRETKFTDVPPNYYGSGYIASAVEQNIITGMPDQTFQPEANITRGDVALIIQRAFKIPDSQNHAFSDVDPNKYYAGAVNSLFEKQIITGYLDQSFQPERNITRAEFSVILTKALGEGTGY